MNKSLQLVNHLFFLLLIWILGCKLQAPLSVLGCVRANCSVPAPVELKPVSDSLGTAIEAVGNYTGCKDFCRCWVLHCKLFVLKRALLSPSSCTF